MYPSQKKISVPTVYTSHPMNKSCCIPRQNFTWILKGDSDIYSPLSL